MARYNSGFVYNPSTSSGTFYGAKDPATTVFDANLTVFQSDYRKNKLTWSSVDIDLTISGGSHAATHWKIVKSPSGVPDHPNYATYVVGDAVGTDGKVPSSASAFNGYYLDNETKYPAGTEITYSFWVYNSVDWFFCGSADSIVVEDSANTTLKLMQLLPSVWVTGKYSIGGMASYPDTIDPVTGEKTDLYKYLYNFGFYYDKLNQQVDNLYNSSNYRKLPRRYLELALINLGFDYEPTLGTKYGKSLYRFGNMINSLKGSSLGVSTYIRSLTHLTNTVGIGTNLMLNAATSSFEGNVGTWGGDTTSFSITKTKVASTYGSPSSAVITLSSDHNFNVNDLVTVSGVSANGSIYNGTFVIQSIPSTTSFTYVVNSPTIAEVTGTLGTVTHSIIFAKKYGASGSDLSTADKPTLKLADTDNMGRDWYGQVVLAGTSATMTTYYNSANSSKTSQSVPVTPGNEYYFSGYVRRPTGNASGTTSTAGIQAAIEWFDFQGNYVGSSNYGTKVVTTTANTWYLFESSLYNDQIIAPATAAYAGIKLYISGATSADKFYLDSLQFTKFPDNHNISYKMGLPIYEEARTATLQIDAVRTNLIRNPSFEVDVSSWGYLNGRLTLDTSNYKTGSSSCLFTANSTTGAVHSDWMVLEPDSWYTFSAYVKGPNTKTAKVGLEFTFPTGDKNNSNTITDVSRTAGSSTTTITTSQEHGYVTGDQVVISDTYDATTLVLRSATSPTAIGSSLVDRIPVTSTGTYSVSLVAKAATNISKPFSVNISFYDSSGAPISGYGVDSTITNSWSTFTFAPLSPPAGAVSAIVYVYVENGAVGNTFNIQSCTFISNEGIVTKTKKINLTKYKDVAGSTTNSGIPYVYTFNGTYIITKVNDTQFTISTYDTTALSLTGLAGKVEQVSQTTILEDGYSKYLTTVPNLKYSSEVTVNPDTWTRIYYTVRSPKYVPDNGAPIAKAVISFPNTSSAEQYWVDACLLEKSKVLDTFFSGAGGASLTNPLTENAVALVDCLWEKRVRTNWVDQSTFSGLTTGSAASRWSNTNASSTVSEDFSKFGSKSLKVVITSTGAYHNVYTILKYPSKKTLNTGYTGTDLFYGGETVTASAYIYTATAGYYNIILSNNSGTNTYGSLGHISAIYRTNVGQAIDISSVASNYGQYVPANTWTRISQTFTLPRNTSTSTVGCRLGIGGPVGTMYIDGVQLEVGRTPTPFIDPALASSVGNANPKDTSYTIYSSEDYLNNSGRSYYWPRRESKFVRLGLAVSDYLPLDMKKKFIYGKPQPAKWPESDSSLVPNSSFENGTEGWVPVEATTTVLSYTGMGSLYVDPGTGKNTLCGAYSPSWLLVGSTSSTPASLSVTSPWTPIFSPGYRHYVSMAIKTAPTSSSSSDYNSSKGDYVVTITWYGADKTTSLGTSTLNTLTLTGGNTNGAGNTFGIYGNRWNIADGYVTPPIGTSYARINVAFTPTTPSGYNAYFVDRVILRETS